MPVKFYFMSVAFFTVFIAVWLYQTSSMGAEEAFRKSLFQVISLQTSTGFATADYMLWPSILWGCLLIVMIMGACAGSTTGGIKCIRMVILFKVAKNEFKHILHPNAVLPVRVNKQVISPLSSLPYWHLHFVCNHRHYQHSCHDGLRSGISRIYRNGHIKYRKHGTGTRHVWPCLLVE